MATEKVTCPGCDRKFNSIYTMTNHGRSIHWWSEKQIEGMKREQNKTGLENATARPWEAGKSGLTIIAKFNGLLIANTRYQGEEIDTANPALIVRAVNSHDALIEALKRVREDFKMLLSGEWDTSTDEGRESAQDSIDVIDTALKLAKEA